MSFATANDYFEQNAPALVRKREELEKSPDKGHQATPSAVIDFRGGGGFPVLTNYAELFHKSCDVIAPIAIFGHDDNLSQIFSSPNTSGGADSRIVIKKKPDIVILRHQHTLINHLQNAMTDKIIFPEIRIGRVYVQPDKFWYIDYAMIFKDVLLEATSSSIDGSYFLLGFVTQSSIIKIAYARDDQGRYKGNIPVELILKNTH